MNTDNLLPAELETVNRRIRIRELHEEGLTPREIARKLDLSAQAIYRQLSNLGLKPNPRRAS